MRANIFVILISVIVWVVCLVVQSSANGVHNHGMISPFESSKHKHKLHCDINRHELSDMYCPHNISYKNKENTVISIDCNGKTSSTVPVFSQHIGNKNLMHTAYFKFGLLLISQRPAFLAPSAGLFQPRQIDHPPRNV